MSNKEDFLGRHGQDALRSAAALNGNNGGGVNFAKENIWFDWGNKNERVIRLVGDFKAIRSHWIGESKFGQDVAILNPGAFKGDNKIPMQVACGNWQVGTETEDPDGDACPVCRLGRNADAFLKKYGKELVEADKNLFKAIRRKCAVKCNYLFKVIDRENPYLDDDKTKKGYKILRANEKLLKAILALSDQMKGIGISSIDEGIDITIKKVVSDTARTDVTYTALAVMEGMKVKQTPLTDEEKEYRDLDLAKFAGKPVDKDRFEEELTDDNNVKTLYENADMDDNGDAPF